MKRLMLCLLIVLAAAFMLLPSAALAGDLNDLIAVVTIDGKETEFRAGVVSKYEETLRSAFKACAGKVADIEMIVTVELSGDSITIDHPATSITFHMAHNVMTSKDAVLLKDSEGPIFNISSGSLRIESGIFRAADSCIALSGTGTATVAGGTLESNFTHTVDDDTPEQDVPDIDPDTAAVVSLSEGGTFNMSGGVLSGYFDGRALPFNIRSTGGVEVSLSGGTTGAVYMEGGSLNVSGSATLTSLHVQGGAEVNLSGGNTDEVSIDGGSLNVSGSATLADLDVQGGAEVNLSGGNTDEVSIDGGSLKISGGTMGKVVMESGSLEITGGSLTSLHVKEGAKASLGGGSYSESITVDVGTIEDILEDGFFYLVGGKRFDGTNVPTLDGSNDGGILVRFRVLYSDWDEEKGTLVDAECFSPIFLDENSSSWNSGWYIAEGDLTIPQRVNVSGDVHLILTDGCKLTASYGIQLPGGSSLTIYGQSDGDGKLVLGGNTSLIGQTVTVNSEGVDSIPAKNWGRLTINGGDITADAGYSTMFTHSYAINVSTLTMNAGSLYARCCTSDSSIPHGAYSITLRVNEFVMNGGNIVAESAPSFSNGTVIGLSARQSFTMNGGVLETSGNTAYYSYGIQMSELPDTRFNMNGGTLIAKSGHSLNCSRSIEICDEQLYGTTEVKVSGGNIILSWDESALFNGGICVEGRVDHIVWEGGNMYGVDGSGSMITPTHRGDVQLSGFSCRPVILDLSSIYGTNAPVTNAEITLHGLSYGFKDVVTDKDGKICIFLPNESVTAKFNGTDIHIDANSGGTDGEAPPVTACSTPSAYPGSRTFTGSLDVYLSCATPNAVIHYTTDSSVPTADSPVYDGPIHITGSTTISAVAMFSSLEPSGVMVEMYTLQSAPPVSTGETASVVRPENGSVTLSAERAPAGSSVTLTVKPDAGYRLKSLSVTDSSGAELELDAAGEGKYSFTMPEGGVTVRAEFERISSGFTDLAEGAWYADAVDFVLAEGLMDGVGGGLFAPELSLSRSMLVTILWRMAGEPVVDYALPFEDVAGGAWYTEAIRWAASDGIVSGMTDTSFAPDADITREQFAAMLCRYADYSGCDTALGGMGIREFEDCAEISDYALSSMGWAVDAGLFQGDEQGRLTPGANTTRAQAAALLMRFAQWAEK